MCFNILQINDFSMNYIHLIYTTILIGGQLDEVFVLLVLAVVAFIVINKILLFIFFKLIVYLLC